MCRRNLVCVGVVMVGSALAWGSWAIGQERVKVEVTVPAVPNFGTVTPSQAPSELAAAPGGMVYVGSRGAYHVASAGARATQCFATPTTHSGSRT